MKKALVVAVLLLAVVFVCVGCCNESNQLKGTFVSADGESWYFDGNGTVTMTAASFPVSFTGAYTVSGSTVTISIYVMGEQRTGTVTWSGNTITDDETGTVYTKQ